MVLMCDCSNSQFSLFRSTDRMYIDKTLLIKDILDHDEDGRFLYTRPRRFGKSLNRSMLDCFFNIDHKGNGWFDGLKISELHQYDVHKNRYPVINLDMSDINADDLDEYKGQIRSLIFELYMRFSFLIADEKVDPVFRQFMTTVLNRDYKVDWIYNAIPTLMRALHDYYGERVVVLIDEYDHSLTSSNDDLEGMTRVLSTFLVAIMKKSPDVKFAYVTGVTQLYGAGLFSGVNNLRVDSILDSRSGDRFGFTEDEVLTVLENIGCVGEMDSIRRYYDGYRIGDFHIYNPYSIIRYGSEKRLDPFWMGTSNINPLRIMLDHMDNGSFESVYSLLNDGSIHMPVDDDFTYRDLHSSDFRKLITLMVMTGYLTAVPSDDGSYDISIPNEEVRQSVRKILNIAVPLSNRNTTDFVRAFMDRDVGTMVSSMENILVNHSYFDLKDESSYAIILMQVLSPLMSRYEVKAQVESGNGRVDIMLRPTKPGLSSVVIEIKRVKKERKLEKALDDALDQIHNRRYTMGMEGDVVLMGFAFWGKVPAIRIESIPV